MSTVLLILIVLVFIGLPLLQIRKQNQRVKQVREFQSQLRPGMVVQMTSGLQGRVIHVSETTVDLEISAGVVTTWDRTAVLQSVDAVEGGQQQAEQLSQGNPSQNNEAEDEGTDSTDESRDQ